MDAGRLRERVRIQQKVRADDGGGGAVVDWLDVASVWANVKPLTGLQRLKAEQIEASLTHTVTIRYRADVAEAMRLFYRGRYLFIHSVIDLDERRTWLSLMCEEFKEP